MANSTFNDIKNFYDEKYYEDPTRAGDGHLSKHYQTIASKLDSYEGKQVLDVACGTGEWLNLLANQGAIPSGIDLSTKAIDICKQHFSKGTFKAGKAEQLPFQDDTFDLVTCLGSMEHFLDPVASIKEMIRVAKQDAQFLILVPNSDFFAMKLGVYRGTNQADVKEDVRSLAEWEELLSIGGLQVNKRYKDLHILDKKWILKDGFIRAPFRATVAALMPVMPLKWQYQVYHLCQNKYC